MSTPLLNKYSNTQSLKFMCTLSERNKNETHFYLFIITLTTRCSIFSSCNPTTNLIYEKVFFNFRKLPQNCVTITEIKHFTFNKTHFAL